MFNLNEADEVVKRVFELDDIYIWGFLVISLGGLIILIGQGIVGFFKKRMGPEGKQPKSSPPTSRSS